MAVRERANTAFRACTLNVGGLAGHPAKVAAIMAWAASSEHQVFLLQETSTGASSPLEFAAARMHAMPAWRGWSFYTPGSGSARGCWVLIKPSPLIAKPVQVASPETADMTLRAQFSGRLLRVDLLLAGREATILCVYAPATPNDRVAFYGPAGPLAACLTEIGERRLVLMAGDFNCCASLADYAGPAVARGQQRVGEHGARLLSSLLEVKGLHDVWRAEHGPAAVDVTHLSAAHGTGARLDKWLVSDAALGWQPSATSSAIRPVHTDHFPVTLTLLVPPIVCMGTGIRGVSSLSYDQPDLAARIREELRLATQRAAVGPRPEEGTAFHRRQWQDLKSRLRDLTHEWEQEQRRLRREQAAAWEAAGAAAKAGFLAGPRREAVLMWDAAGSVAVSAFKRQGVERHKTALVLDHTYGMSKGTFYAFEKAQPPPEPRYVQCIQLPAGAGVADMATMEGTVAALTAFRDHFSADAQAGLFRARGCDLHAREALLNHLPQRLAPDQAAAAEGPDASGVMSEKELTRALSRMKRGVAPGADGLTVEFYTHFWGQLLPLLHAALREAFADVEGAAPLASMLLAVFTMIHKPGKPADAISSYRPIALLGVDLRILARALADRLQLPLEEVLIDVSQSAFVAHRDISDNVLWCQAMADYARKHAHQLWLLLMDFASAYDRVDWSYLTDTMRAMGLREEGHVRWAQLLHRGAQGYVSVNRWLRGPFPLASGLLQGSAASPVYWCIALQPLTAYLTSLAAQGRLECPRVPQAALAQGRVVVRGASASRAHADDNVACVSRFDPDEQTVREAANLVFGAAGGPSLSVQKCQACAVGPAAAERVAALEPGEGHMPAAPLDQPVRYLGVPLGPHLSEGALQQHAYSRQPRALSAAAGRWRKLALNMLERAHVSKQCIASKVIYQLGFTQPTPAQLQHMQRAVRTYAALEPQPAERSPYLALLPGQLTCAMPRHEGGLGYPMLGHFSLAMQAKTVAQLVGPVARSWQPLVADLVAHPQLGLASWVVTAPQAVRLDPELQRWQAHIDALASLQLQRVVQPAQQSWWSVMAEPLYLNPVIGAGLLDQLQPAEGQLGVQHSPQGWRYVRDVYAALHPAGAGPPSEAVRRAAAVVSEALPESWRPHLLVEAPPPCDWSMAALPRDLRPGSDMVACKWVGAVGAAQVAEFSWVLPNGRLKSVEAEQRGLLPADLQWEPAAVVGVRKKPQDLTQEEREAQQLPAELRPPWPLTHWLLGPWATVWLDPTVHGWHVGKKVVALHDYTVREARARLLHMAYEREDSQRQAAHGEAAGGGAGCYTAGAGAWPRLWGQRPQARLQQQGRVEFDDMGLRRLQDSWVADYTARLAEEQQQQREEAGDRPPGERDAAVAPQYDAGVQHKAPARPAPAVRHEAWDQRQQAADVGREGVGRFAAQPGLPPGRAAAAGQQQLQPGIRCTDLWHRTLRFTQAHESHCMVGWKVLHGALMVGAQRLHMAQGAPCREGCCVTCRAAGRGEQLETLTHVFMDCPAVQPVLTWLLQAFQALAGELPPRDPLVLLADARWHWQPEQPRGRTLWQCFRLAYLGAVWAVRSSGLLRPQLVVDMVVRSLATGVQRDWQRVVTDVLAAAVGLVPTTWFRGRDPHLKEDEFKALWPGLGGWYEVGEGQGEVRVRLSAEWPVALDLPLVAEAVRDPAAEGVGELAVGDEGGVGGQRGVEEQQLGVWGVGGRSREGRGAAAGQRVGGEGERLGELRRLSGQLPPLPLLPDDLWPPLPASPPPPVPDSDG